LGYRRLSLQAVQTQPHELTFRKGLRWLRGDARLSEIALILVISALSLAVVVFSNGSWRLQLAWLMLAPAAGLAFGAFPAWVMRRSNHRLQALALDREQLVSLLLKDYAGGRGDWLWSTDAEGNLRGVNDKLAFHAGRSHRELEGKPLVDLMRGGARRDSVHLSEMIVAMRQRKPFFDLSFKVRVKQDVQWWRLAGKPLFRDGRFAGFIGTASDVTAEIKARESVNHLAFTDGLTGLSNRSHFNKRLEETCVRLKRYGTPFALFYLDLDKFKAVNDTRGHRTGDLLLIEVGRRLGSQLRATDTVARLGGDEFAVILPDRPDEGGIATVASRLIAEVERPYVIDGDALIIGLSIGVAQAPANGRLPDEILHHADIALYRAKGEGGNRFCLYESAMDAEIREREELEREIAEGLEKGEFFLDCVPVVSAKDDVAAGLAASMQWNHPTRGLLPQSAFLSVAERSTLISALGDRAILLACAKLQSLPPHIRLAVSLATKHFMTTDICATVLDTVGNANVDPRRLELQVEGALLLADNADVPEKLGNLCAAGVGLTLRDFGSGLSGMSHLLSFPGNRLMVDRTFVERHLAGGDQHGVLNAIVTLAHAAGFAVAADGVESAERADALRRAGFDFLQGSYFAGALPLPAQASSPDGEAAAA
jgi:diguanylate cyclase (GGDEF)-like protein/PAS domain S-box-containing protein